VQLWGENPHGQWKLQIDNTGGGSGKELMKEENTATCRPSPSNSHDCARNKIEGRIELNFILTNRNRSLGNFKIDFFFMMLRLILNF